MAWLLAGLHLQFSQSQKQGLEKAPSQDLNTANRHFGEEVV